MSEPPLNHSQSSGIFDPRRAKPVTVIGAGSVGSQVVTMLAKIGCTQITVWDPDVVESHNLPMSAYGRQDMGKKKVHALRARVLMDSGVTLTTHDRLWNNERLRGTVVACVDTMEARMQIWDVVRDNPNVDVFVDTRIAEEYLTVYALRPCDKTHVANYAARLYPSSEAVRPVCGEHGIIYVSAAAAQAAVARVVAAWTDQPFSWQYKFLAGSLSPV